MTLPVYHTLDGTNNLSPTWGADRSLFTIGRVWQPSSLSYITLAADASGNLLTSGSGGGGGGVVTQGTVPWVSESSKYAIQVDASSAPVLYVGEAVIGTAVGTALWRLRKVDTTGGNLALTWANGSPTFSNIWTNRLSYTYS